MFAGVSLCTVCLLLTSPDLLRQILLFVLIVRLISLTPILHVYVPIIIVSRSRKNFRTITKKNYAPATSASTQKSRPLVHIHVVVIGGVVEAMVRARTSELSCSIVSIAALHY